MNRTLLFVMSSVTLCALLFWCVFPIDSFAHGDTRDNYETAVHIKAWKPVQTILIVYVGCLILISPWIVRNYRHFHKIIYSSIGIGNVLWPGNNLATNGYWEGNKDIVWSTVTHTYSEVQADSVLTHMAIQAMRAHPRQTALLWLKKAGRYWSLPIGYETLANKNSVLGFAWVFWYWLLLLAAGYGLFLTWQQPVSLYVIMLLGYLWSLHIVLYAIPRYHYALIPLLAVVASVGVVEAYVRYAKK